MNITLQRVDATSNIEAICVQMTPEAWGTDNEMTQYQPEAVRRLVSDTKNILLLAYDADAIAGAALAYEIIHPDGNNYVYVHEVDTHPSYRRQGIGTLLMKELMQIAKSRGCLELWLETDDDNPGAQKLYESLGPTATDKTITYSYTL